MPGLTLLRYPDPGFAQVAAPFDTIDDDARQLADDLLAVMYAAPGLGLSACHAGVFKRLVVVDLAAADGAPKAPQVFFNPVITSRSDRPQTFDEGSVCMPGVTVKIGRPDRIEMHWLDRHGQAQSGPFDGFLATVLQHEIDQLDGVFFLERASKLKRDRALARWKKLGAEQNS